MGLRDDPSYLKRRMMRSSFGLLSQTTRGEYFGVGSLGVYINGKRKYPRKQFFFHNTPITA
ncbi:unnamed protein product [Arabidopsis halleri]